MPCCWQNFGTGVPLSACFNPAMIWLEENQDLFTAEPPHSIRENSYMDTARFAKLILV